jgi:hypothetical protein
VVQFQEDSASEKNYRVIRKIHGKTQTATKPG